MPLRVLSACFVVAILGTAVGRAQENNRPPPGFRALFNGKDLSGTARLIGDIELNANSLSKGVFYGMVNPEMTINPRWGAERTAPAPEVTAPRQEAGKTNNL